MDGNLKLMPINGHLNSADATQPLVPKDDIENDYMNENLDGHAHFVIG